MIDYVPGPKLVEMYDGILPKVDAVLTRMVFLPNRKDLPYFYHSGDIAEKFLQYGVPKQLKVPGIKSYTVQEWRKGILFITRKAVQIPERKIDSEQA